MMMLSATGMADGRAAVANDTLDLLQRKPPTHGLPDMNRLPLAEPSPVSPC